MVCVLASHVAGASESELSSVKGRVLEERGNGPVRDVTVMLSSADFAGKLCEAITDTNGAFRFEEVPPGRYNISLVRGGQISNGSRLGRGSTRRRIALAAGQHLEDLVFWLPQPGIISGQVTDVEGQALPNARVVAFTYVGFGATRRLISTGSAAAQTDDQGRYRLHGLEPGRYLVRAVGPSQRLAFGTPNGQPMATSRFAYEPTLYPGVVETRQAVFVTVRAGQEAGGVDFRMRRCTTHFLGGIVGADSHTVRAGRFTITLRRGEHDNADLTATTVSDRQGRFFFAGVASGRYQLSVHGVGGAEEPLAGHYTIDVDKEDVRDLTIPVSSGLPSAGVIRVRPTRSMTLSGAVVKLAPADFNVYATPLRSSDVDPAGTFTFPSIPPGRYRIWVEGLPANCVVERVRHGTTEIGNRPFQVQPGIPFEIDVSSEASSISGTFKDADQSAETEAYIILTHENQDPSIEAWCVGMATDQYGGFYIGGLPPGRYKIYAFDFFDSSAGNGIRAFLEQFDAQSLSVELRKNENKVVEPKLIQNPY